MTAGDKWEIANAWNAKAMAASNGAELRERVQRTASLLERVGNVHQLGDLLSSAAYTALCVGSDRDAKELIDRAVAIARGLEDRYMWMVIQGNAGLAALLTGDTDAAERAFREELMLCRELVMPPIASEGLLGLAGVAAVCGDVPRAARLVGAASAHQLPPGRPTRRGRPAYGEQHDAIEARLDTAFFARARTCHTTGAWEAAVREGAALSFEDAIGYALEEPDARRPNDGVDQPAPSHASR